MTNEHIPTAPPVPVVDPHFASREEEEFEEEGEEEERTAGTRGGVEYIPHEGQEGQGGYEWTDKERDTTNDELEYVSYLFYFYFSSKT